MEADKLSKYAIKPVLTRNYPKDPQQKYGKCLSKYENSIKPVLTWNYPKDPLQKYGKC